MSALYFDARINGDQLQKDIANINRQIGQISVQMKKEGTEIDAITRRIGTGLTSAFGIFAGGKFIKDIASVRGEFQQLNVAFETMLGSKAKADKLMAEVVDFAARTPFELTDVAAGTKQLLAYGIAADNILPTLKSLGDVSAGLSVPIERLILNYGQVRTQLKLTGRELRDFNVAGVPLVAELAKQLGVAESKIADMVERGQIGFPEVEKAFRSMTEEGGRFNNLMDKQSKTITGLASNFKDAWDKMLNAIGQQNEGIISGSIQGAITLTEHYEDVIKILKILIATYGTYKAAVIATAVVEKSAVAAGNIKAWFELARGIKTAKDAQIAFNLATKANPYGIILAAVASLITVLTIYGKKANESAQISAEFTKNLNDESKAIKAAFDAVKNAKDGTNERTKAIQEVNDKYKQYLPNLLTEADNLYEVEKAQNAVTTAIAKTLAFKAQEGALTDTKSNVDKELQNFYKQINDAAKKLNDAQKGQFTALIEQYKTSLREQFDQLGYFPEFSVNRLNEIFKQISGKDLGGWALGDLDLALKSLIRSEIELEDKTNGLKTTYEEYLKALGIGEAPKEPAALVTINQKIQETKKSLEEAKQKLDELRSGTSTASITDIENQEKKVKELESTLETLTGVSKKVAKDMLKAAEERYKALQEYAEKEIELERSLQSSKVAIMQNGAERQKAEAELAYQQELDRIKQQQQAYLEAYNAKLGFKPGDSKFITELPTEALAQFDQLRVNAEQEKNNKIEQINRETANEIKTIWNDVSASFNTDIQNDIIAIDEKYDKLIERAKQAGETNLKALEEARNKEKQEAYINSDLDKLNFQEQIEQQRAEISTQGYNRDVQIEKKKLEIVKKYAQLKIDLLKKSGTEQSKLDIEQLQLYIDAANNGLEDINKKTLADSISKVTAFVDEFKELSNVLFGVESDASRVIGGLGEMGSSLARIAAGDYSGVISLLTSIAKFNLDTSKTENKLAKPWEEFEKWIAASNRELQRYIKLRDEAIGADRYTSSTDAIDEIIAKIQQAENELSDLSLSFTVEGSGWFSKARKEVQKQVQELIDIFQGQFVVEDIGSAGFAGWSKIKEVLSFDLQQLLYDENGEFTITKINKLIDEGHITDSKVIEAINYYEQLVSDLTTAEQQKQELLTATMAGNIADSIIDGFAQGYKGAEDFADDFEQLMKNAVLNAIKIQTLEQPLQEWYKQFAADSESGNVLTEAEIAALEARYNEIINSAADRFEQLKRIAGLNFDTDITQQGLTGAIQGITEETGSLIAGQFYAMRELQQKTFETGVEQLASVNVCVSHLAEIAENTRYNSHLETIDETLKAMNIKIQADL